MSESFALIILIFWLFIPLFWIPVHLMTNLFRRLGILTHLLIFLIWLPLAFIIYKNRALFVGYRLSIPFILRMAGWLPFIGGILIHLWTGRLLSLWGLIGLPEIYKGTKGKLVTTGIFSVIRHPTYLAHTMIFIGGFLITGIIAIGILTIIDLLVVLIVIIPIEERELINRFGYEYIEYRNRVPRFLPFKIRSG